MTINPPERAGAWRSAGSRSFFILFGQNDQSRVDSADSLTDTLPCWVWVTDNKFLRVTTMNDSNAIRDAIERSKASGQIQTVSVEMTADALEDLLLVMLQVDWEMTEIEDHRVDVWGWSDATPEGDQDWRLTVQCVAADELVA